MTTEMVCALCFGIGIATGAGVSGWLTSRAVWIKAVRRFKDRTGGRSHWQLVYRAGPRVGPSRDHGTRTVRESLLTSMEKH